MEITPVASQIPELGRGSSVQNNEKSQQTFMDVLNGALQDVNEMQRTADKLTQQYLTGETSDIAQVLLATEKANLALQLTVQVRNKIVDAYKEIAGMQI